MKRLVHEASFSKRTKSSPCLALACDGDGTVTTRKVLARRTLQALDRFRKAGHHLILVTGETPRQLKKFPALDLFDWVVAENGALLYWPASRKTKVLAEPPPAKWIQHLRKQGISPLIVGKVIVSTCRPHDRILQKSLQEFTLKWHVIYNRKDAMALPQGIDKATGLRAGCIEWGLSPENVVGIGDAQNDVALLRCCGWGVAVGNAVTILKEQADLVMGGGSGTGVVQLIDQLLEGDLPPWEQDRRPIPVSLTYPGSNPGSEPRQASSAGV